MSIDSRYREQVDLFCEAAYKVGSEEMLEMAKTNSEKRTDTTKKIRFARKAVLIPLAAAVFVVGATVAAGAAGFGPLSELFTRYFGDSATKKLADEGYIYTAENYAEDTASDGTAKAYPGMGEALEKDIFSAKILGIAGDTQDPMMLMDIRINDPETAAESDIIGVYTRAMGVDEFENRRDDFGLEYSKGVKDEDDPTLYHVSTRVPPYWVTNGEEVVVDLISIHTRGENDTSWELGDKELSGMISGDQKIADTTFYDEEIADFGLSLDELGSKIKVYDVDMQFRFTVPKNVLKEDLTVFYDGLGYEVNGTLYRLDYGNFGAHKTIIRFDYDDENYDYMVNPEADKEASEQFTLTVDGVEYKPDIVEGGSFIDKEGIVNLRVKDLCYMSITFPAFDFENAQSIVLSANGVSYEIKQ